MNSQCCLTESADSALLTWHRWRILTSGFLSLFSSAQWAFFTRRSSPFKFQPSSQSKSCRISCWQPPKYARLQLSIRHLRPCVARTTTWVCCLRRPLQFPIITPNQKPSDFPYTATKPYAVVDLNMPLTTAFRRILSPPLDSKWREASTSITAAWYPATSGRRGKTLNLYNYNFSL